MKKFNILLFSVVGLLAFSACTDNQDPVINSLKDSDNNAISFVLNAPSNSSYTLIADNANSIIDIFTCEQPNYGFSAAVTYTVQVCKGNNEFVDLKELATKVSGERIPIKTFELNDAMNALGMANSTQAYDVDFRLKALINDSVQSLYSNTVSMTVTPYSGARTKVYFVGSIFNNGWNNNDLTMRLFADDDLNDMLYTYTGYVPANSEFKLIQNPGSYDVQWGYASDGVLTGTGNPGNIGGFTTSGYYTMNFDLDKNTYSVVAYTGALTEYNQISLIGDFNSWGADLDLTQATYDKHIWINSSAVIPSDGKLKLRVNHDWATSFGGSNSLWEAKQGEFAKFDGGDNVKVKAGTYFVKFNDITKHIIMIAQ